MKREVLGFYFFPFYMLMRGGAGTRGKNFYAHPAPNPQKTPLNLRGAGWCAGFLPSPNPIA
jgi:hypothetical protein